MTKKLENEGFKPEDFPGREFEFPDGHAYFGLGDEGPGYRSGLRGAWWLRTVVEIKIPKELFGVLNS